jgi:hypothetical protein
LTTAACGGLRSTPDCRTRRALLHLSYSCALSCGPTMLVTQPLSGTLNEEQPNPCVQAIRGKNRHVVHAPFHLSVGF